MTARPPLATALNIGWTEIDELEWTTFVHIMDKLEEIRGREESALRSASSKAKQV